jgi:hypothetical protein
MLVFLFVIGGVLGVIAFLSTMNLMNLFTGVIYEVIGIMLITSKNIKIFFEFQRKEFDPDKAVNINNQDTIVDDEYQENDLNE